MFPCSNSLSPLQTVSLPVGALHDGDDTGLPVLGLVCALDANGIELGHDDTSFRSIGWLIDGICGRPFLAVLTAKNSFHFFGRGFKKVGVQLGAVFDMLGGKAVMDKAPMTEGRNILMILSPAK